MKKIICLISAILISLASISAIAEIDLSGMTFDELVSLKDQINLAIWNSAEWQEVTVPQGAWKVGEDIPAGHWTVKPANSKTLVTVSWGDQLADDHQSISFAGTFSIMNMVYGTDDIGYKDGCPTEYSFEVKSGQYISFTGGSLVFMPYSGKPSLGFK